MSTGILCLRTLLADGFNKDRISIFYNKQYGRPFFAVIKLSIFLPESIEKMMGAFMWKR